MSRKSASAEFTYSSLSELSICYCDTLNDYLWSPSSDNHYVACSPDFGLENAGKNAMIFRDIYGGKSAGDNHWQHAHSAMKGVGFVLKS